MAFDDQQERTEQPTVRRLREARIEGRSPPSVALIASMQLLIAAAALYLLGGQFTQSSAVFLQQQIDNAGLVQLSTDDGIASLSSSLQWCAVMMLPFFATMIVVLAAANLSQTGIGIYWHRVIPNWDAINPFHGFSRLANLKSLAFFAFAISAIIVAAGVAMWFAFANTARMNALSSRTADGMLPDFLRMLSELALWLSLAFLSLSAFDVLFQRWNYRRQLMMTKDEVREEAKAGEVDQQIRNRLSEAHRQLRQGT